MFGRQKPRLVHWLCAALLVVSGGDLATAESPEQTLRIDPSPIHLSGKSRRQRIVISEQSALGPREITLDARVESADPEIAKIVRVQARLEVVGVADGTTSIRVDVGSNERVVPVTVDGLRQYPPVNFENDIIPVFAKLGCNSGGCHGKQSGQNGFKLSVFGFDPQADFAALVKEARGRRLFPADPERSLLLTKAIGTTPHGGGRRTELGSPDYEVLLQWIRQGMPYGRSEAPRLSRIDVYPSERVLDMKSSQSILVTAVYTDGSKRDVSTAAAYSSNAPVVADVSIDGRVDSGLVPGEAAITVNYMGQVGVVRVTIPRPNVPNPYPQVASFNAIDPLVWRKLQRMGIVPSELVDDATFLRRVFVDTIGTLPNQAEVRRFLSDQDEKKRSRVIDELLERPEFADYWALRWADILLVNSKQLGARGSFEFHSWLRQQIAKNRPYDVWTRELLTATGDSGKLGPANFYRALRTSDELTRAVSQAFLGVRLDCAQCHHHPFEKWGQEDFYGLAGYFSGVERKSLPAGRELIYHSGHKPVTMPRTGIPVATRPPDGQPLPLEATRDPRKHLADWMTSPENPWFARLLANRLWKHFLGRGLVEPEDDMRSTNPATNEPLLQFLADEIVASRFDIKATIRLIVNSRVYQLSSRTNPTNRDDRQNYSHYIVKRLPAEVLLDAICEVTGAPESFPGLPAGTRSIQLWDNRLPSYFLDTFGRSLRESPCACGKSGEPTMAQALHLMNAPEIEAKIVSAEGRVANLMRSGKPREQVVEELCLVAFGRFPTDQERQVAAELFQASDRPQAAAEDLLWTLLNSYDFLFVR